MYTIDTLPGPDRIERYRTERYTGEDAGLSVEQLGSTDRALLEELYSLLRQSFVQVQRGIELQDPMEAMRELENLRWNETIGRFSEAFGHELPPSVPREHAAQVYHDMRGSALSVAGARVQLAFLKGNEAELSDLYAIFYAVRDHLKILRNCVTDLDPERRERDLRQKCHSAALLREKWQEFVSSDLRIEYHADFDGDISSSCLEFSSLERVLYNMINNAAAHTVDKTIRFFVTALEREAPQNAKFAVANFTRGDELEQITDRFDHDLSPLFDGGFTIGGTGVGLSVVAQTVANAYGLDHPGDASRLGYVGAQINGTEFITWAHWPVADHHEARSAPR
jgi:signal transduction histidine kinase